MNKFTLKQLQDALIALHPRTDDDALAAFEMTFEEVHRRMGDEAFDVWCESQGW